MTKHITKNILITGASDGIGAALAKRYAAANTHLFLLARNVQKLEQIASICKQKNALVSIYPSDVTEIEKLQTLVAKIDTTNPIDLVICNAGVTSVLNEQSEAETWGAITSVIDTNLYGVLATLNPLITKMRQRKCGQIAIVSSLAAYYGMPITPIYCASKSAVKAYGESLRGWLKADGIKVSVVLPGFVKSSLSDQFTSGKPFMVSPEKAADIIVKGLEKNYARIAFPFPMNFGMWVLSILPAFISGWIMSILYGTKSNNNH